MRPSLTSILSTVFICYILNSLWTLYQLYSIPECLQNELCIPSYLKRNHAFKLLLYTSTKKDINNVAASQSLMNWENFDYRESFEKTVYVDIPQSVINNGSLYIHAILLPKRAPSADLTQGLRNPYLSFASNLLTVYAIPEADAFQLLSNSKKEEKVVRKPKGNKPITHWKSILRINIIEDDDALPGRRIPSEIIKFINLSPENEYLPVLYIDSLSNRVQEQIPLNQSSTKMPLIIQYSPMKFGKLRLWVQLENAVRQMSLLGFTPKDTDEVKGIFTGTNLFVLGVTFSVAAVHLLFDFLAFKNDVSFWRKKKSMVGLSTRTVIWRAVSQIIIFFYLMDENTSLLVLIPSGIGTIIEIWKVLKAVKVKISFSGLIPKFESRAATKDEIQTEEFDAQSMKYLLYLLYPLCAIGAIYSLLYVPHKGWYSWTINSLVNGVYAFGFLFMLPQLFVNYKHKSVSHLPWKAFMYKAFNTFIDDLFAFIITMPTAHRIACFRDDLVFLVYLYQRWLYPVDKSRVNEFGESFEDDIKKNE